MRVCAHAMGGVEKRRGLENLTNATPPKKRFWTPPRTVRFPPPLRCQCSVFPMQKSTTEQTRSSFGGVQRFSGERVLWYVFLPPSYHSPMCVYTLLRACWCGPVAKGITPWMDCGFGKALAGEHGNGHVPDLAPAASR